VTGCGDLIDDLGFSLVVLARAYQAAVSAALNEVPHGPRGYQTLSAVAYGEQPTQRALANYLGIDRTVMTYVIDDLVAAGLVERRLNPADRRERKIVATAKGTRTVQALTRKVDEAEAKILEPLSEAQRTQLRELLSATARHVKESDLAPCDAVEGGC
jgi:MarR family transcriptional regulator, transcriptional regulator for hemolysin